MLNSLVLPKLADIRGAAVPFEFDKESGAITVCQQGESKLLAEAIRQGYKTTDNRVHLSSVEMAEKLSAYFSTKPSISASPKN